MKNPAVIPVQFEDWKQLEQAHHGRHEVRADSMRSAWLADAMRDLAICDVLTIAQIAYLAAFCEAAVRDRVLKEVAK